MAGHGAQRKATVLRIANGAAYQNPGRTRSDAAVRPKGRPEPLEMFGLNAQETKLFNWLMDTGCLPAIHSLADSLQLAQYCRLCVERDLAAAKVREFGQVMKHPTSGKPMPQPFFTTWMALNEKILRLANELALTPAGRMRHAPPANGDLREPTSWDEID